MHLNNEMCKSFLKASGWLDNHDKELLDDRVNASPYVKRKCLVLSMEEFNVDLQSIYGPNFTLEYEEGYEISLIVEDTEIEWFKVLDALSKYYNCNVTTIHTVYSDEIEVWICYR